MDDNFDELVIDVRASTQGFATDLEKIRTSVDQSLLDGFDKAGSTLERSLVSALRKGTLGFDDLKRIAVQSLDEIASHALTSGIGELFGGQSGGLGGFLGNSLGALLGLPGRATGGPVGPGKGYIVGENGPELFVPTSSGRIERGESNIGAGRDVRVAINMVTPRGVSAPAAMRRSSRQVASAVRQAIQES
ncbi:MAG: tail tape measure protein [Pseudomonadota bacterium]